ncbi:hypothetical protein AAG906_011522 [Vitis piasezkii]
MMNRSECRIIEFPPTTRSSDKFFKAIDISSSSFLIYEGQPLTTLHCHLAFPICPSLSPGFHIKSLYRKIFGENLGKVKLLMFYTETKEFFVWAVSFVGFLGPAKTDKIFPVIFGGFWLQQGSLGFAVSVVSGGVLAH